MILKDSTCVGAAVGVGDVVELVDDALRGFEELSTVACMGCEVCEVEEERILGVVGLNDAHRLVREDVSGVVSRQVPRGAQVSSQVEPSELAFWVLRTIQ